MREGVREGGREGSPKSCMHAWLHVYKQCGTVVVVRQYQPIRPTDDCG